jgi:hypothetical protein
LGCVDSFSNSNVSVEYKEKVMSKKSKYERVLELVSKYDVSEEDLEELNGIYGVMSDEWVNVERGSIVKIIRSEYKNRLGEVVDIDSEWGRDFIRVKFGLLGEYLGKYKIGRFEVESLELVRDSKGEIVKGDIEKE